jgi:arylsulfatase A-like enzyme
MRVPFIAAWAKPDPEHPLQSQLAIPAGAIQTQQAAVYDLFPTILKTAGISVPARHTVDGAPLQTLLTGKPDPARPETFLMHYPHTPHRSSHFTSYREGQWKVVHHYFPGPQSENSPYQLFHLGSDPFEQHNLASERPEELRRMMQALAQALQAHNALYPVSEDGPVKPRIP